MTYQRQAGLEPAREEVPPVGLPAAAWALALACLAGQLLLLGETGVKRAPGARTPARRSRPYGAPPGEAPSKVEVSSETG